MLEIGDRVLAQTIDDYNEKFGVIKEVGDNQNFFVRLDEVDEAIEDGPWSYALFGVEELIKVKI